MLVTPMDRREELLHCRVHIEQGALLRPGIRDGEEPLLSASHHNLGRFIRGVGVPDRLSACVDQRSQHRLLSNNLSVGLNVRG